MSAMVKAWGDTSRGLIKAAFLSGFFRAFLHSFNLGIHPFPLVGLQILSVILSGFFYAAMTLVSGSIWPANVSHMLVNAAISLQVF